MDREIFDRLSPLVTKYRARCLWFLREDFLPNTLEEAFLALDCIERHGDREAFIEVRRLKTWLSQNFSETSAS